MKWCRILTPTETKIRNLLESDLIPRDIEVDTQNYFWHFKVFLFLRMCLEPWSWELPWTIAASHKVLLIEQSKDLGTCLYNLNSMPTNNKIYQKKSDKKKYKIWNVKMWWKMWHCGSPFRTMSGICLPHFQHLHVIAKDIFWLLEFCFSTSRVGEVP